jgi:CDP-4-dehydro-6-deoxyglucose reductase, E1
MKPAADQRRCLAVTDDGRDVVVCRFVGAYALCFDHATDTWPNSDDIAQGVQRLEVLPLVSLRLGAPLPWQVEDILLREQVIQEAREHAELAARAKSPFVPGRSKIAPSGKVVGAHEAEMLVQASLDLWLTAGRFSDQFELAIAQYFGVAKAIAVNSGSSANLIALSALTSPHLGERALKPGDEVITAAAGFPTTVNPILQNGLVPVFIDSELETGNLDSSLIESAIGPRTRAIIAAHTLGNPMDMRTIVRIAKERGLWLVEDCCDAFGSTIDGQLCGTFGDIATLSFYPAHHITMGEGGAVFSRDAGLMRIAESFRDWGRDCYCAPGKDNTCGRRFCWKLGQLPEGYDHKYTYSHAGYNLKITDMQAAVGLAQLQRLPDFIAARRRNHAALSEALRDYGVDEFLLLPEAQPGSDPSWFGFLLILKPNAPCSRNELTTYLEQQGIGTRLLFAGNLTRQPYFEGRNYRASSTLQHADVLMERAFWIGVWPGLEDAQIAYMACTIAAFLGLYWDEGVESSGDTVAGG